MALIERHPRGPALASDPAYAELAALSLGFGVLLLEASYLYSKSCGGPSVQRATALQTDELSGLFALFLARAEEKGDTPFLWAKRQGQWRPTSWGEAARQVAALAASLKGLGLERGDRVALVSE